MTVISLIFCSTVALVRADASPVPEANFLEQLTPNARKLGPSGAFTTLDEARGTLSRAIIFGIHPLTYRTANRIRRLVEAAGLPDDRSIVTRAEIEFADLLPKTRLSYRALNLLAHFDVRTLADLRALTFENVAQDSMTKEAIAQLKAMAGACPLDYSPST